MKIPDVYRVEKTAFPNSVVEVATAVPAFIGYTEKALNDNESLLNKPMRITSMAEFILHFGGMPKAEFTIEKDTSVEGITFNKDNYVVKRSDSFNLYFHMLLFYANGGGACYIVSVGNYENDFNKVTLEKGIDLLLKEQEVTMIVIPEAVYLSDVNECYALQKSMLNHCGYKMRNRFALLDIYDGYKDRKNQDGDIIINFREGIGSEFLDFGAAYYPWINTSISNGEELNFSNMADRDMLKNLLLDEIKLSVVSDSKKETMISFINQLDEEITEENTPILHKGLNQMSPFYQAVIQEMHKILNLMPVSAAMAGIYTMVDNTRGVWKAPANVNIAAVMSPSVNISHEVQEDLNVPIDGKSVNAIRSFVGEGVKVWGARTLDGNSLDWRYINVRRTMIMLEESVKNAARAYVFDPNVANTWINVKSMIGNFLNGIWKRGGLAGSTPDDAFSVHVGLGETMTPEDILEGIMRITVLVAIVRPAEFLEITFQQQMQKS